MRNLPVFIKKQQYPSLLALCLWGWSMVHSQSVDLRPNILLLVADDLAYADLGCYGGDIETPNIDSLASRGLRFSRFHTSPYCAPTRAMLLSGNDNHIAGMGLQGRVTDQFGYEGRLTDRIATIPQVLSTAGYHTYMAGKWHLGLDSLSNPHEKGFERSFALLQGAGNHYDDQGVLNNPKSTYTENGKPAGWQKGKYSTDFYTDKLIQYIGEQKDDGRPFFAFAAYTSPHWPLQVDEKYWKKYKGRYDEGYEKLKEKRLQSLKNAGMIPSNATLPPNHPSVLPWDSLSQEQQKKEARKMELYAGMLDNLDENIGRLLQYLRSAGQLENTLVLFISDNGAAAEDFYYGEEFGPFLQQHFNNDYENMGKPSSFVSYGPQWAEAGSAPFRYFKSHVTEGGIIAPMIIAGPRVKRINEVNHNLVTILDIAPSLYEVAQAKYPSTHKGKKVYPLKGHSMLGLLTGKKEKVHSNRFIFALEHGGKAMLRKGDWKITNNTPPYQVDEFELYNLATDPAELHDLKALKKGKYQELLKDWQVFAKEIKVQFPAPAAKK